MHSQSASILLFPGFQRSMSLQGLMGSFGLGVGEGGGG